MWQTQQTTSWRTQGFSRTGRWPIMAPKLRLTVAEGLVVILLVFFIFQFSIFLFFQGGGTVDRRRLEKSHGRNAEHKILRPDVGTVKGQLRGALFLIFPSYLDSFGPVSMELLSRSSVAAKSPESQNN